MSPKVVRLAPPDDGGWDDGPTEYPELDARVQDFARGDHVELAERLEEELLAEAETVYTDGQFYQYQRGRGVFVPVDPSALSRRVQAYGGARVACDTKPLRLRAPDVKGTTRLTGDRLACAAYFEAAAVGVAFSDSFVRVGADRIACEAHSPNNRARFAYPFAFSRRARPERLLGFLGQVFRDDIDQPEKIELIREFFGAALLGLATRFQRVLVLLGAGANGKSVLTQLLEHCAPPGSVCSIPPQDLGQEYRRAMLAGKLLNIVSELPEADIFDSESWKATVAGDSLTGRPIREAPFSFKPVAGHIYSANRLPGTADQTLGFWRRLHVVQFNRVFAEHEQNPQLVEVLKAERPAIVCWALEGAQSLLARGAYTVPTSSAGAVEEWRKDSDQVLAFVEERTRRLEPSESLTAGTPAAVLYDAFKTWAQDNGHRAMASNKFGKRMAMLKLPSEPKHDARYYPVRVRPRWEGES